MESVCWSESGTAVRMRLGAGLVRNVTAYGATYGVKAVEDSGNSGGAQVVNTIARGGVADMRVFAASGGIGAIITVTYSNYLDDLEEGTGSRAINPGAGTSRPTRCSRLRQAATSIRR